MNPERPELDFISNREPPELTVHRRVTKYLMFYKWESVRGETGELRTYCSKPGLRWTMEPKGQ